MKYYKQVDEEGNIIRVDKSSINSCNGPEITEEEYNEIVDGIKPKKTIGANFEFNGYEE